MDLMIRHLYLFLIACDSNWRNSICISSRENGPGYLLAADRDGKPLVIAIEQLQQLTGEQIDPDECRGQLTQSAFKDIYAQYLFWHTGSDVEAPLSLKTLTSN